MTTEELRGIVLKQFYDRPEPPPLPFRSHPSPRLRQIKGGGLQSHQASRVQEFLMGGEVSPPRWSASMNELSSSLRTLRRCAKWMREANRRAMAGTSFSKPAPSEPLQSVIPLATESTAPV